MTTVDYYTASKHDLQEGLNRHYFFDHLPVKHSDKLLKRVPLIDAIEMGPAPGPLLPTTYTPPRKPTDYPTLHTYLNAHTVPLYEKRWTEMRRSSSGSMKVPLSKLSAEDPFSNVEEDVRTEFNQKKQRFWTVQIWGFDSEPALSENRPTLLFGTSRPLLDILRFSIYETLLRDGS